MQKPDSMMKDPADEVKALICQCNRKVNTQRRDIYLWNEIDSIVHREQPVMTDKSGESVYSAFHHDPISLGILCDFQGWTYRRADYQKKPEKRK